MPARTLDMRQLKHVLELDRYKNFSRAAESLCISQPALTKSIQHLESTLGVTLFDRHGGGIVPTAYCEVILCHARRVLLELEEMNYRLDSIEQLRGGELKIGTGPIMAETVLAAPVRRLIEEMPELRIDVVVDDWSILMRMARQGDLHVVVADIARVRDESDFEAIALGRVENILVCRPEHPLAAGMTVAPCDFLNFPLALPRMTDRLSNWLTCNAPNHMSAHAYCAAVHRIQCQSVPLLRSLVRESNCITGGPRKLFERELEAGSLVELRMEQCDALYSEPSVSLVKGRTLPPSAYRFIEVVTCRPLDAPSATGTARAHHVEILTGRRELYVS